MFRVPFPTLLSLSLVNLPAAPAQEPDESPLIWRGCGITRLAFMHSCAEAYTAKTGVEIKLSGGGATLGIQAVGQQAADFGGTCRRCLPELNEPSLPLQLSLVAWDALAVVVHPNNPIDAISSEQLEQILKQEITDWSSFGLPKQRIAVVTREGKTSGVGRMTRELILGNVDADYGKGVIRLKSSGPVEEMCE